MIRYAPAGVSLMQPLLFHEFCFVMLLCVESVACNTCSTASCSRTGHTNQVSYGLVSHPTSSPALQFSDLTDCDRQRRLQSHCFLLQRIITFINYLNRRGWQCNHRVIDLQSVNSSTGGIKYRMFHHNCILTLQRNLRTVFLTVGPARRSTVHELYL